MGNEELKIEVGTPATLQLGSDRYEMDVVRVTKNGIVYCRFRHSQEVVRVRKYKTGYRTLGHTYYKCPVRMGIAESYQCPEF